MRYIALLLLPAALHASAVTSIDQLTDMFCGQIPSCYDYPVLPPEPPPIPEAPGYTLGPYVGVLYLDGVSVPDYPGTTQQFIDAEIPAAEDWEYSDGYASFAIGVYGGYLFEMNASPELVSAISDPRLSTADPSSLIPEPSSLILVLIGAVLMGIKSARSRLPEPAPADLRVPIRAVRRRR
jgi:hypothetical protein